MVQQKQFLDVIDRDQAVQRFESALNLQPPGTESIPVSQALHRVLAVDVVSPINVPSFDRSNFDGFAVRSEDTIGASEQNPRILRLLDERIATATIPIGEVTNQTAAQIATGAMLPRGADAVVLVEDTDLSQGDASSEECVQIVVSRSVVPGFGISFAGTDIASGQTVLRRGDVLSSRENGVLAAIGATDVTVYRRPRVAVISTGDEIIPPGSEMKPSLVYDSNARIIADAVRETGGEAIEMGIAIDDEQQLRRLVNEALRIADAVLLSGGTSKGDGDLSYKVAAEFDDPGIVAHGVALKPGKPICLAVTDGKPLVILPGFPTSAVFTFHEFVAPVIRILAGLSRQSARVIQARIATKINSEIGRKEYLLVRLTESVTSPQTLPQNAATLVAYPIGKGSGSVTTFSNADGFVAVDRYVEMVDAGTNVDVQLIGNTFRVPDLTVIGSHCPGVDLLLSEMQSRGFRTRFFAVGSSAGLQAAKRGDCDIAGIHLYDETTGKFNQPFVDDTLELITGYRRMQSLIVRRDEAYAVESDPRRLVKLLVTDNQLRMVNRNAGSGTRNLIDRLLKAAQPGGKPAGYPMQPGNHHAVVAAISQHRADWGVAIEAAVHNESLKSLPLEEEHFDFVIPKLRADRPAIRAFCELLANESIKRKLASIGCNVDR